MVCILLCIYLVLACTGISGLRWLKQLGPLDVTMCELSPSAFEALQHNCVLNGVEPRIAAPNEIFGLFERNKPTSVGESRTNESSETREAEQATALISPQSSEASTSADEGIAACERRGCSVALKATLVFCDSNALMHAQPYDFM